MLILNLKEALDVLSHLLSKDRIKNMKKINKILLFRIIINQNINSPNKTNKK
jgi:hypothetical protein